MHRRTPIQWITDWLQTCGIFFIATGMGAALSAAAWNFMHQTMAGPSARSIILGSLFYLLLAGISLVSWRLIRQRFGSTVFLWAAVLSSLMIQLFIMMGSNLEWHWTNDAHIFHHYLERLALEGYSPHTLGELSQNYDYRVWTRRAQPFYMAIYNITGDGFVRAVQLFQVLLVGIALLLTWRLARLIFGQRVAFWATTLQWLMPFRWFSFLDLNHHLLGGLYYLIGLWILVEWIRGPNTNGRKWLLAICATFLLPLLRLEGGIDLVYVGSVTLVVILNGLCSNHNRWQPLLSLTVLLGIPLTFSFILLSPLAQRIEQNDIHHHESGLPAFMARGWSPETGGEYAHTYEVIDYLTPVHHKKPVQLSILASQALYNQHSLLFSLLPIKMAKFFLLGYAAGAEEMLEINGAHMAKALATGARAAFLLGVLPLMIWGSVLLLPLLRHPRRMPLVLPCTAICATYILLGETSPRYSIYIQPFLFMLGALPLAWPWRRQIRLGKAARFPATKATVSLILLLAAATLSLAIARPLLQRIAFADMRSWNVTGGSRTPLPSSTLAPMEIHLHPTRLNADTVWDEIELSTAPEWPGSLSFYIFAQGVPSILTRQTTITVKYASGTVMLEKTNSLPGRISLPYSTGACGRITVWTPGWFPYSLQIGYATYEPVEETTE